MYYFITATYLLYFDKLLTWLHFIDRLGGGSNIYGPEAGQVLFKKNLPILHEGNWWEIPQEEQFGSYVKWFDADSNIGTIVL